MKIKLPSLLETTLSEKAFRRNLGWMSLPFLALELAVQASLFLPPGPTSLRDEMWAFGLLALAVALFFLPIHFVANKANLLIPVVASFSAMFAIQASGGANAGAPLILLAPLIWTALYLRRWKSLVVLCFTIPIEFLTSNVSNSISAAIRWRRAGLSMLFGMLIIYAIQELRQRFVKAASERERASTDLLVALEEVRSRDHVITNISQGILITDPRARGNPITFASSGFERITGYSAQEVIGQTATLLGGPLTDLATLDELRETVAAGRDCLVEVLCYRKDGTTFWCAASITSIRDEAGKVVNFVAVFSDITARRDLEEKLRQSQKMEVVGTLSAGIAHDFNNSLLVIRGYNSLIAKNAPDETVRDLAQRVDDAVHQASTVTHRLLNYSRFHEAHPSETDLNQLLSETIALWERLIGDRVQCQLELDPDLPFALVDRSHIEQVIVNLITNARDAMPAGGTLTVHTSRHDVVATSHPPTGALEPGAYAKIEVKDTGAGMDEATRAKIFDPFFTTKIHGTGLGLSTVENVIRETGGRIEVTSSPGEGTSVHLYLPASPLRSLDVAGGDANTLDLGGDETVLVVEDLAPALELLVEALGEHGYHVLSAANGLDAMGVASAHRDPLPLLITDVDMPKMSGADLARQLLLTHRDLKVIFVSGYPSGDIVTQEAFAGRSAFVAKPYDLNELLGEMRRMLPPLRNGEVAQSFDA